MKNKKQDKEQELWEKFTKLEAQGNITEALNALDDLINFSSIKHFYCSVKTRIFLNKGDIDNALKSADEGLGYNNQYYPLYKEKAEILYRYARNLDDINLALNSINAADTFFSNELNLADISNLKDLKQLQNWITDSTRDKAEIISSKRAIELSANMWEIYNKILDVEGRIEKEKLNSIELLGIFTAILALIFSNVQMNSNNIKGIDLMWFNLGMIGALSWFILLIVLVSKQENAPLLKSYRFWAILFFVSIMGWGIYFLFLK